MCVCVCLQGSFAIQIFCYPEKHEHYMMRLKSLNVKVNIGSIKHCRSEMVVLCCECLFVCICLPFAWIHFILHCPSAQLNNAAIWAACSPCSYSAFLLVPMEWVTLEISCRNGKKAVILADAFIWSNLRYTFYRDSLPGAPRCPAYGHNVLWDPHATLNVFSC